MSRPQPRIQRIRCTCAFRAPSGPFSCVYSLACMSRNATTCSHRIIPACLKNFVSPGGAATREAIVRSYYFHPEGLPSEASTKFRHGIVTTIHSGQSKHLRNYQSVGSFRSSTVNFHRRDHYTKQGFSSSYAELHFRSQSFGTINAVSVASCTFMISSDRVLEELHRGVRRLSV